MRLKRGDSICIKDGREFQKKELIIQLSRVADCPAKFKQNKDGWNIRDGHHQRSFDIGNIDVLDTLERDIGLTIEAFKTALESRRYAQAHHKGL